MLFLLLFFLFLSFFFKYYFYIFKVWKDRSFHRTANFNYFSFTFLHLCILPCLSFDNQNFFFRIIYTLLFSLKCIQKTGSRNEQTSWKIIPAEITYINVAQILMFAVIFLRVVQIYFLRSNFCLHCGVFFSLLKNK